MFKKDHHPYLLPTYKNEKNYSSNIYDTNFVYNVEPSFDDDNKAAKYSSLIAILGLINVPIINFQLIGGQHFINLHL